MAPTIKAIETRYNGYRFRSRLEARWAVFMDTLGVRYEYEVQGFNMNGLAYLPDFYLPDLNSWLEVKGVQITENDESWEKAYRLAELMEDSVYVFCGQFPSNPGDLTGMHFSPYTRDLPQEMISPPDSVWWFICPLCKLAQLGPNVYDLPCMCLYGFHPDKSPAVVSATLAAREARFERF